MIIRALKKGVKSRFIPRRGRQTTIRPKLCPQKLRGVKISYEKTNSVFEKREERKLRAAAMIIIRALVAS